MQRLRIQLPRRQQAAGTHGVQYWHTADRRLSCKIKCTCLHQLSRGCGDDLKGSHIKSWVDCSQAHAHTQVGFKIFLNITPTISNWSSDNKQFSLIFEENPLADFVELPDDGRAQDELWFSNILVGVLRGALEMVCTEWGCTVS